MNNASAKIILINIIILFSFQLKAQDHSPFVRYPAINNDGTQIAFSYQGDIWTMNLNDDLPRRLTVHPGFESMPQFSPDAKTLAFQGNRFGNIDIFTIPVVGGNPKRLTYHSANTSGKLSLLLGLSLGATSLRTPRASDRGSGPRFRAVSRSGSCSRRSFAASRG